MPAEVKAIPSDWTALPGVRFLNTQVDGERDVRLLVRGDYDVWLLTDPLHELTACIGVHRPSRRVWFMEITRTPEGGWQVALGMVPMLTDPYQACDRLWSHACSSEVRGAAAPAATCRRR